MTAEPVDEPPEFQSGSRDSFTYRENGTYAVYTYRATDPEGADISWRLSGMDAHAFRINGSGELTFSEPSEYEEPEDANRGNEYHVTVEAPDETSNTRPLEVTVTVVNLTD